MISSGSCHLYCLGYMEYNEALTLQNRLANMRLLEEIPDSLLLVEHPPTYTLGRQSNRDHFRVPQDWIDTGLVSVFDVDRGGQVTFHGPGQLVGYPILRLDNGVKGIVHYIRKLENMLASALLAFGIQSESGGIAVKKFPPTGVWVNDEKIGAIGIKVDANRITTHGFALNINTDLSYFKKIIPCGVEDRSVTSLERCLGYPVPMAQAIDTVVTSFAKVFRYEFTEQCATCVV